MTAGLPLAQGAGIQQQGLQKQHGVDEAPVIAAQEPHQGVAAPATGLYALVRPWAAADYEPVSSMPPKPGAVRCRSSRVQHTA